METREPEISALSPEELRQLEEQQASGVEPEIVEDEAGDPFDPDEISINSKVISMEACLRRLIQGTIELNPDFQRKEVWTMEKKSQLIESLMLKIPLPMFYVSSDEQGDWAVVDGLQRLSTIRDFVLGESYLKSRIESERGHGFNLQKMEFWTEYNGKTFFELPNHLKNRILETEFTFTIINPGTPEEVKRNIFKRINTGGEPLSAQEIRNALYIGESTSLLKKLAESEEFKTATAGSVSSSRMDDQELVLRFLAFLIRQYPTYTKTIGIDRFLSETMIILNAQLGGQNKDLKKQVAKGNIRIEDISYDHINKASYLFKTGMTRAHTILGIHTFRKSYGRDRRSPINKSLFEMWGVLLSLVSNDQYTTLLKRKSQLLLDYKATIENLQFQIWISRDSMKSTAVKERFMAIQSLIDKHSNDPETNF